MPTSRICVVIESPASPLWERLADFPTWGEWVSQVADSVIEGPVTHAVGALRHVGPAEAPRVHEQLVAMDARNLVLSYRVTEQPRWRVPARDYHATVRLISLTDRAATVVEWSGRYDCDRADEVEIHQLLESLYSSFIAGLSRSVADG